MAAPGLRIELLGTPRLVLPDGRTHVLERHDAALLALLTLQGPLPRNRLVGLLWPDVPLKTGQGNLRQRLFRLRKIAGATIVVAQEPAITLADGLANDLGREIDTAQEPAGSPAETTAQRLLGSLDYDDSGELGDWIETARQQWQARWREHTAKTADALEAAGRHAEALIPAQRLALDDPSSEQAHRRVMRLHYLQGDRAAALAAFERCREALARELGVRPSAETLDLAGLIQRSGTLPSAATAPSPVAVLRPPQLIGRDAEWARLQAAWDERRLIVLRGEPGIGKSRLAADFASARHAGAASYRAQIGDVQQPYALLARLWRGLVARFGTPPDDWVAAELARLLPELGTAPAGRLEVLRLRDAGAAAMRHWQQQGLAALVVEDLQFADDASLEWLFGWAGEPGDHPALLLTVRSADVPAAMAAALDGWPTAAICDITLGPLPADAIGALLDSFAIPGLARDAWAEALRRHTGGNPMFLLETLRAELMRGPIAGRHPDPALATPAMIGDLLQRRLRQLPPQALQLARVAALAGPDFSPALAARVQGVNALDIADAWNSLEQAQIIRGNGFAHDLILEAATHSVPESIGALLHREIALALSAEDTPPGRLARHWQSAGEPARAAPAFEAAAHGALAAARPLEALQFWDAAADSYRAAGRRDAAFRAHTEAIDTAITAEPSDRVTARIDALLADASTDSERLDALLARAKELQTSSRHGAAEPIAAEALALARRLGDVPREIFAAGLDGAALASIGRVAEGLALFDSVADRVDALGDRRVLAEFCGAYGYALCPVGRLEEALAWIRRAADLWEALGSVPDLAIVVGNLSAILNFLGRHDEALAEAERARGLQVRLGGPQGVPYAVSEMNLGRLYLAAGRYDNALAALERGLAASRAGRNGEVAATFEHQLATLHLQLGQPAKARQLLTPLADAAVAAQRLRRAAIEGRIDRLAGRAAPARLRECLGTFGAAASALDRLGVQLEIAAALPADEALALVAAIREEALAEGQPTVALTAQIREADALRRLGRTDDAAAAARSAAATAQTRSPYDLHWPEFWWIAFQALEGAGLADEAMAVLRSGSDWLAQARPHVPEAFLNGYLNRSAGVAELLAAAGQRLNR